MTIFFSAFALSVVSISFSFVINNFLIYWLNFPELFNLFIGVNFYWGNCIFKGWTFILIVGFVYAVILINKMIWLISLNRGGIGGAGQYGL